jgi:hypothetical protein
MASILSSLFGVGTQQQQQPQAGVVSQQLPEQIAPYYEKLLKEAESLYKQKMEAGAPTYEGKTIAGFTPEQEQLFTGLQGLQGTQAPKFAEAEALTRGTAQKITPDEVQEYMNPYQQAVVDIEKREAQKQYESTVVPQLAAQAAATGGFGGSRQAILEGMASEANQRLLGDIQAKGSAQAYQDAMTNIQQQRQREGAAGAQLATMAPAGFAAQAQELGAIGKVGDVKQQQAQLALDEAYKQYMQEQQFPSESLKEYQSYVQSFPNIPTQITRTPPQQGPGLAQSLLGLGTTALGTYGAFGGFSPGGFMGMKQAETGGGIAGLPVVQAAEGTGIGQRIQDYFSFIGPKIKSYIPKDKPISDELGLFGLEGTPLTEEEKAKKKARDRFKDISIDDADELNRKVREAREAERIAKGREFASPSVDPIMETSPEAKKDMELAGRQKEQSDYNKLLEKDRQEEAARQAEKNKQVTAVKDNISQYEDMLKKIGPYEDTDTSGVTSAMGDARKIKQDVISRLGTEGKEIDEQRIRDISAGGIEAGKAIMNAPNLFSAITEGLGVFGKRGKVAMDTAKDKKKANREKAEAIGLEIANDKVAEQQFILGIKDKDKRGKVAQALDIIKTGGNLSNARVNLINAETEKQYKKEKVKIDRATALKPKQTSIPGKKELNAANARSDSFLNTYTTDEKTNNKLKNLTNKINQSSGKTYQPKEIADKIGRLNDLFKVGKDGEPSPQSLGLASFLNNVSNSNYANTGQNITESDLQRATDAYLEKILIDNPLIVRDNRF